jgi:MFS family permease
LTNRAGRLGDIYGHKRIFMAGWAWFALWSLIAGFCGEAQLLWFSTCRAFQGIGPALLIPNAIALIGRSFPVGLKRNLALACFGAAGPTGAALGAVLAALVSEKLSWPWCFWLLAITCSYLVAVSWFVIPEPETASVTTEIRGKQPKQVQDGVLFDWPGAITGVTGLVLVNFALNQAPLVGWSEPYIPALLILGFVFLISFIYVELRVARHPIIPIRGLQRHTVLTLTCVFTGWSSHGIWVYYLYLFLEQVRGHSALLTSAETSPVAVTGIFFAFLTVWLMRRISVSWIMLMSMFFFLLGSMLIAVMPLDQTYWANTFTAILLMPGAMNLSFPAATILLSTDLPKEKQGIAASLVATVVNYSISCGLGFAGSIHKYSLEVAAAKAGLRGPQPALSTSNTRLVEVRLVGLRSAYLFAVALGVLGMLIAALFIVIQGEAGSENGREEEQETGGNYSNSVKRGADWTKTDLETRRKRGGIEVKRTYYLGNKVIRVSEREELGV